MSFSVAVLEFELESQSEQALAELSDALSTESAQHNVYHPWFDWNLEKCTDRKY